MYTIAVELHGYNQLERLSPSLIEDVTRQCIAAIEIQGGTYLGMNSGMGVFRFTKKRPEDHNSVLECLEQVMGILRGREDDLAGWTVYCDYIQSRDEDVAELIKDRLALVSVDNCAWLGDDAESLVGHYLQIEDVTFGRRTFHRILKSDSQVMLAGTVDDVALMPAAVDGILEAFDPNQLESGAVLIYGDDSLATRVNTDSALSTLAGDAKSIGWLEFETREDDRGYGPLVSGLTELHVHETRFWLSESEQTVWDERLALFQYLIHPIPGLCLPDRLVVDLVCALELYISAFVRRATDALAPPVVVCHDVHRWPAPSVDVLGNLLSRFEGSASTEAPLVLFTASSASVPSALLRLVKKRVRLPRLTMSRVRDIADQVIGPDRGLINWERLHRCTSNRSDLVLHYLNDPTHWDRLSDSDVEALTPLDLAWHTVLSLDGDVQEVLLGVCYVGDSLRADDLLELLTEIGVDRVRVTAVVSQLRSFGLVEAGKRIVTRYPEMTQLLEGHLGESARTVYERVARSCERLLSDGRLLMTEKLQRLFYRLDDGQHVPRLYHELVGRTLDQREITRAHRLLYDAVPTNGFTGLTRSCLQAVLYTNRLRLALLQANLQEAERVRAAAEKLSGEEACGFVLADLTLERARLAARTQGPREALTLIKRAIMTYQDQDDAAGLARGNLDFGLVLLAQEDVLEAREYFQIASKMAGASGNLFEQVRSDLLQLISTFIDGNFSRVFVQAEKLRRRTSAAGMREVQLFAEFAEARSLFELGCYDESASAFEQGRSRSRFYGWKQSGDLFRRWLARSLVYDQRVKRGLAILEDEPEGREVCFFRGEAWLLAADHGKALAAIDRALELPAAVRGAIEGIAWETGYAGLEDRAVGVFDGSRVMEHQLIALRGYVLAQSGRVEEGVEEMHKLTREMKLSEIDPFNRMYYYLYSQILPDSGDSHIEDRGTILGRAVRYIQERTSRLDEYNHKTDFLRKHYWNYRLMSRAQSANLV